MRSRETRQYNMLVRVRSFVDAHGELLSASSAAAEKFAVIEAVVTQLGAHDRSKMSATRRGSTAKAVEAFETAIRARDTAKDEFTAARTSIADLLASGLAAARTLDAVIANHYRDDRGASAAWLRDRRVGYRWRI